MQKQMRCEAALYGTIGSPHKHNGLFRICINRYEFQEKGVSMNISHRSCTIFVFLFLLSVVPVLCVAAGEVELIKNGAFERSADGKPAGWTLAEGSGAYKAAEGVDESACVTVAPGKGSVSCWTTPLSLKKGGIYTLSFQARMIKPASDGCIVSGPFGMNRDFSVGAEWQNCLFAFPVSSSGRDMDRLRLGTWENNGVVAFDDVTLNAVKVFHRKRSGVVLGDGEKITGKSYSFQAPLNAFLSAYSRPLADFNCGFNSYRWTFSLNDFVQYHHNAGNKPFATAQVVVNVGYHTGAAKVNVLARRPGSEWILLGGITSQTSETFTLPSSLFPTPNVDIRLVRPEKPAGSIQVHAYHFNAEFADDPGFSMNGATSALVMEKQARDMALDVQRAGDLLPGGNNTVAFTVTAPAGTKAASELVLVSTGKTKASSRTLARSAFTVPADGIYKGKLSYQLRSSGQWKLVLLVKDSTGTIACKANLPFSVPPLYAADYGWTVPRADADTGLWWCTATEKIGLKRPPSGRAKPVTLEAAGNEEEALQLVLHPEADLSDVSVTFTGPADLPVQTLVRRVGYVDITVPTDYSGCTGMWPDPLPPHTEPVAAPAGQNTPFWLSIRVKKGCPRGTYPFTVSIACTDAGGTKKTLTIPVRVRIFGFSLPDAHSIKTAFGFSAGLACAYHGISKNEKRRELFDCYMQSFREHRISPYSFAPYDPIRISFPKTVAKGTKTLGPDQVKVDFSAWTKQARKYLDQYHFDSFRLRLRGLGGGTFHSRSYGSIGQYKQGSAEYRMLLKAYASQIENHLRKNGWLDEAFVYWFDEPQEKDYEFVQEGMKEIHLAAPGLQRMLTEEPIDELKPYVDIWCPVLHNGEKEAIAERLKAGDTVWWYVCCGPKAPYLGLFIDHPATDLRTWVWLSWKYGVTGLLVWQSNYWTSSCAYPDKRQDPWKDPMSYQSGYGRPAGYIGYWGNGDGRFLYPPQNCTPGTIAPPVDSIRWEMLREGIEDYEYLTLLRKLIERKKGAAGVKIAQYKKLLEVPASIIVDGQHYTRRSSPIYRQRRRIAEAVEALAK